MVKQGRKSYLGPVEIASFSSQDFSRSNKHDTFWDIVSTGYFYILFLWVIAVSDFCPLEIFKNLDPPLSTITFTVKSHPDKNFYKYIYLFQILWFFIETHVKVHLIFKFDLNVKHPSDFFLIRTLIYIKETLYRKSFFL